MQNYKDLLDHILSNGSIKGDRTGTGTLSTFGNQLRFDLRKSFPAVTLKKLYTRTLRIELIWFLGNHLNNEYYKEFGRTNIKYLVDNNCNIWNDWPYKAYCKANKDKGDTVTLKEFISLIKYSDEFAKTWGNLGPVYGKQWRDWETKDGRHIDQIAQAIHDLKTNPDSRRIIVNAWNVGELEEMNISGLSPCHRSLQFYSEVIDGERYLSLQWDQRSSDVFLGIPFNIASYGLLLHMIAQVTGHKVKELIGNLGDCHLYSNHIDQSKELLNREPKEQCTLWINPEVTSIDDFDADDFEFKNYISHPALSAPIAV